MKVLRYLALAATIQAYALPNPKVILEGENGIAGPPPLPPFPLLATLHQLTPLVNDDGSTSIDGETGITTNSAGQTTNVGGPSGITIGESPAANSTVGAKGTGTAGGKKGNLTSSAGSAKGTGGAAGLAALIGALEGVSQGGNTNSNSNGNGTAAVPTAEGTAAER